MRAIIAATGDWQNRAAPVAASTEIFLAASDFFQALIVLGEQFRAGIGHLARLACSLDSRDVLVRQQADTSLLLCLFSGRTLDGG